MHRYTAVAGVERSGEDEEKPHTVSTSAGGSDVLRPALLLLIGAMAGALLSILFQRHSAGSIPTVAVTPGLEKLHHILSCECLRSAVIASYVLFDMAV